MNYPLFHGTVIGFLVALTVGPLTVICIRNSLVDGFWIGLSSGIGAALGSTFFGALIAFNLTWLTSFITAQALILKLAAAIYLLYLGIKIYFSTPYLNSSGYIPSSYSHALTSALFLAITNPMIITSLLFWLKAYHVPMSGYSQAFLLTGGFLVGSLLWWIMLVTACTILATYINKATIQRINQVCSIIMGLYGAATLLLLMFSW